MSTPRRALGPTPHHHRTFVAGFLLLGCLGGLGYLYIPDRLVVFCFRVLECTFKGHSIHSIQTKLDRWSLSVLFVFVFFGYWSVPLKVSPYKICWIGGRSTLDLVLWKVMFLCNWRKTCGLTGTWKGCDGKSAFLLCQVFICLATAIILTHNGVGRSSSLPTTAWDFPILNPNKTKTIEVTE